MRASWVSLELSACSIRCILFADVVSGLTPVRTARWIRRNRGPEMLAGEVSFFATQAGDSALPLKKPNQEAPGAWVESRCICAHGLASGASRYSGTPLLCQRVEDRTEVPTRLAE